LRLRAFDNKDYLRLCDKKITLNEHYKKNKRDYGFNISRGKRSFLYAKTSIGKSEPGIAETFQYTATADTASVANLEWRQFFNDPILQN
jgi:hypothetical protein